MRVKRTQISLTDKVEQERTNQPIACLGVTVAVAYTYGDDDGSVRPTRCACIDGANGSRWSRGRVHSTPQQEHVQPVVDLRQRQDWCQLLAPVGYTDQEPPRHQRQHHVVLPALPGAHLRCPPRSTPIAGTDSSLGQRFFSSPLGASWLCCCESDSVRAGPSAGP
jgi:hypothetical protein